MAHFGQLIVGAICYKFFRGRVITLFVWVLGLNFIVDIIVLITLLFKFNDNVQVFILMIEGTFSALLYYLGTVILPFDLGKIMLLRSNTKIFGQVFGLVTAFKFIAVCFIL